MQNQWQKKKNDINAGKTSELTSEQRELQMYQSQADDIREGQKPAAIDIKLASGSRLNAEEIEYLKKHNPQALKDYEKNKESAKTIKGSLETAAQRKKWNVLRQPKWASFCLLAKALPPVLIFQKTRNVQC